MVWARGDWSLVVTPFLRLDQHDSERTHIDVRQALFIGAFGDVELRFGIGRSRSHTLAEIGRRLKLSRERIRQIEAEALRMLRTSEVKAELLELAGNS